MRRFLKATAMTLGRSQRSALPVLSTMPRRYFSEQQEGEVEKEEEVEQEEEEEEVVEEEIDDFSDEEKWIPRIIATGIAFTAFIVWKARRNKKYWEAKKKAAEKAGDI